MADLGVAHLARRQADRVLRGPQDRVRPVAQEPAPGRHRGGRDRIGGRVAADPEPVEDDEDDRPGSRAARRRRGRARRVGPALAPGHAAAPRAAAVSPARATIPAISSALSEAPPTSAPSIEGSARNSSMLAEVTLPPYRIGTASRVDARAERRQGVPDRAGHRRGVPAARVAPRADRPDRLVGDDQAGAARAARHRGRRGRPRAAAGRRRPVRRPRARRAARRRTGSGAGRHRSPGRACGR